MEDLERHVPVVIRRAGLDEIVDLRHRILRGGLPRETAIFDGDCAGDTLHLAACVQDRVVGCASFHLNTCAGERAWQLRGMAVDDGWRGGGVGARLLDHAERVIRGVGVTRLMWCNARVPAVGFYERQGWRVDSEPFDIPTAGPHVRMSKWL